MVCRHGGRLRLGRRAAHGSSGAMLALCPSADPTNGWMCCVSTLLVVLHALCKVHLTSE